MRTFTISGVFDQEDKYSITKIMINDKEIEPLTPINEKSDENALNSVKHAIAELLKQSIVNLGNTNENSVVENMNSEIRSDGNNGNEKKDNENNDNGTNGGRRKTKKRKYKNNKRK